MAVLRALDNWFFPSSDDEDQPRQGRQPNNKPRQHRNNQSFRQQSPRRPKSNSKQQQRPPGGKPRHNKKQHEANQGKAKIAYHGTPTAANAKDILQNGFLVGNGNAHGDGVYLSTKLGEAKTYSGKNGVYLKCRVFLGRTCNWDTAMQARYRKWCAARNVQQNNSAITGFLMQAGFTTLQSGEILVVLSPQYANSTAWKQRFKNIRVLSVHDARTDQRIRV